MEQIVEDKMLEDISGGGSDPMPSQVICPNCSKPIYLKKKGLFGSRDQQLGVCSCGFKVGDKWL